MIDYNAVAKDIAYKRKQINRRAKIVATESALKYYLPVLEDWGQLTEKTARNNLGKANWKLSQALGHNASEWKSKRKSGVSVYTGLKYVRDENLIVKKKNQKKAKKLTKEQTSNPAYYGAFYNHWRGRSGRDQRKFFIYNAKVSAESWLQGEFEKVATKLAEDIGDVIK